MESIKSMNKDSYLDRRLLFKNIWDAAAHMEKKDNKDSENVPNATKPKIIKTVRLSEEDGININKSKVNKKQRIKNLRIVCTRLLEICNKKETDDILYDQISAVRHDSSLSSAMFAPRLKPKKKRKKRKVVNKTYGTQPIDKEDSISLGIDTHGPITHRGTIPLRHVVPPRIERATLIQQFKNERYKLEHDLGDAHRRVVKKKLKRKIPSKSSTSPHLGSTSKRNTHKLKENVHNEDNTSDALV